MDDIFVLDSTEKYNELYGLETRHPLVSVIDLNKATREPGNIHFRYGLYAVYLKMVKSCDILYGRQPYDYQDGTIVCFAPGQSAQFIMTDDKPQKNVYGLLFHPDIIKGTPLGKEIRRYSFFSYSSNEALHISDEEKKTFMESLGIINRELEHAIDKHSRLLLSMHIQLLLEYCQRFYDRQFITREKVSRGAISRFETLLEEYFDGSNAEESGLPTVRYFADKLCLSANYFGDMVKKETGKTPQEFIQDKIIDLAKEKILGTEDTVSQIAYSLGFQYPQHLCRLFKQKVGCSPNKYRKGNAD
ncbi:MAG: AraC family transcriptional regulator [Bacteroidetes bacterium]|uniref:AraC family transcriptional regulator n=1 Tax=Candidatus Cryptobacteroides intestinigallinarum TaxID=2840767 RepID=A0A9D9HL11_9BACT|nr:AraC family transcriptional regulator [Candidatus Cryptobacteroides intestinigallinarum]